MANDALGRIARATQRVEKFPVTGPGTAFTRSGNFAVRYAYAPGDIKGTAGNADPTDNGVTHHATTEIYDATITTSETLAAGQLSLAGSGKDGVVWNLAAGKIKSGSILFLVAAGSNKYFNHYVIIGATCPAS